MAALSNGPAQGGGGIYTPTIIDYLRPEIARPDLFEDQSFVIRDIGGGGGSRSDNSDHTLKSLIYTVIVILLSAAIFITAVAWADVLRSWFDSNNINPIIEKQLYSRIKYASCITAIAVVLILICLFIWNYYLRY